MRPRLLVVLSLVASFNAAAAAVCDELPVLFIVQDISGSMGEPIWDPKIGIAKTVVPQVAAKFDNRFRYGAMMYPGGFNFCGTGAVASPVASTAADIKNAYLAVGPFGRTPTAKSLNAAKNYLLGLHLATPAYVLLITDGLPNCNSSLDASSCRIAYPLDCDTTANCGTSGYERCCAPTDCLDEDATVQAAAALKNAGIAVYVVGFGTSVSSTNDKVVLDEIAAAGGTGSAYVATSSGALTAALDTIAAAVGTCCVDACTLGAAVCTADGKRQSCEVDPGVGCTHWVTAACPPKSTCTGGVCQSCTDECTSGAARCNGNQVQACQVQGSGCTAWVGASDCASGTQCTGGVCTVCNATCTVGASRCVGKTIESCVADAHGCTSWQASTTCAKSCVAGVCQTCTDVCAEGAMGCLGNSTQSCQMQSSGCTDWGNAIDCGLGRVCTGGVCSSCQACASGATRCVGNDTEVCNVNPTTGCSSWGLMPCASGTRCVAGMCAPCATTCTAGNSRCAGSTVENCTADSQGCTGWLAGMQCTNFCSGGACGTCGTSCTVGAARCNGNSTETCTTDVNTCTVWTAGSACTAGASCDGGVCVPCSTDCAVGTKRCDAAGGIEQCQATPSGCPTWAGAGVCGANQVCSAGVCVPSCTDQCTLGERRCEGAVPSSCVPSALGCSEWKAEPACDASAACYQGQCRNLCASIEFDSCPLGEDCVTLPSGERVCLPGDGGVYDAGTAVVDAGVFDGGASEPDAGSPGPKDINAVAGCGCSGGPESFFPIALLLALSLRKRGEVRRRRGEGPLLKE